MSKQEQSGDHCSCWWDSAFGVYYGDCCEVHDETYDKGGSAKDRKVADQILCDCVFLRFLGNDKGCIGWFWSNIMYIGVRVCASYWFCRYIYPRKYQRFNWKDQEKDNASS